jgi:hypothetical protein
MRRGYWGGRAIGSGQVEGACKHLIGKRLKQTWAKWKVERLNRMTVLCASRYSDHWQDYWNNAKQALAQKTLVHP